ncbi:MAG: hypothetical protein DCC43_09820 [Candidatus Brocadia sp.]|jgi:hypothetical protein|uniref:Uncharacterized protein n=1 Tax=Candidatus Brocadia fulgida TaxID=380242 RepID=A0A0M2UQS0_9BACT|nr:MAG: hypothetical protein BROFUL_03311 [Candidatus Brocadia fulgida]MCC6325454.1 hypothetical protein [Candidatus Brocadia sp.]MCE7912349.1 hypothetical protein [Candidatus Brocadia sp. AMX3]MBV6518729.1 hypothetical protein [Candidatus Brocadia fulgida]MDG5996644.1 hypothetical protein [Candidatus Brocadia sp.]
MITQQQADYLVALPKHIIEDDALLERKLYAPSFPIDDRMYSVSKADDEFSFFLEITQSSKKNLKLTLHFQEEDASIGLLRVDFNGRHPNPEIANDKVPDIFRSFAGQWLEESHIHYFVEGYKPLAWAIPLKADNTFSVKDFTNISEFGDIFRVFGNKINLQTVLEICIQRQLI